MCTNRKSLELVREGSSVPSHAVTVIRIEFVRLSPEPVHAYEQGNHGHVVVISLCRGDCVFVLACEVKSTERRESALVGATLGDVDGFKRFPICIFLFPLTNSSPIRVSEMLMYVVGSSAVSPVLLYQYHRITYQRRGPDPTCSPTLSRMWVLSFLLWRSSG